MDLKTREGRRQQGELIKAAAASAGLTLKELASRLGVSHALIYQYVSGANLAQTDKLQEIAQITGVPLSSFFEELSAAGSGSSLSPSLRYPPDAGPAAAPIPTAQAEVPEMERDRPRLQQAIRRLEALARSQDNPARDLPGLIATLEQMLGLARLEGDALQEANLLLRIGNARTDSGDISSARRALAESLDIYRDLGQADSALSATQSLARCLSLEGDTTGAERLFQEVASTLNPDLAWRGCLGLGQIFEQQDRYEDALREFDRARDAIQTLPEEASSVRSFAEIYVRTNIANVFMAEGAFADALDMWRRNADEAEELSQPGQFLESILSESVCLLALGRPGAAHDSARRAVRLARLLGDIERLAVARTCMAEALTSAGLLGEARNQAREAGRLAAQAGAERGRTFAGLALARSLLLDSQFEGARFYLDVNVGHSSPKMRIQALLLRSELYRRSGDNDLAVQDAKTAMTLARPLGAAHLELASLAARLLITAGAQPDPDTADLLRPASELERVTGGLMDTGWQLFLIRARWRRAEGNMPEAMQHYQSAVDCIQRLRADFSEAGILESCLDDPEKLCVYREALATARQTGDEARAARILADANWPPLESYKDAPAHSENIAPGGAVSNMGA